MSNKLTFNNKIGVLDPEGKNPNPLTGEPYSDQYKKLAQFWSKLPAFEKAQELLQFIDSNQVIFVISGTGSGKSLILPKLALHYTNYKGKIAMILPKRIITLSAATFGAKTLDVPLGTAVGYVYKGSDKSMYNSKNKLIYMTNGTLIMHFTKDPLLREFDVIIIDEAHERVINNDLLLLFLKNLLESGKRQDLRVIIMSATIDGPKYQNYFSGIESKIINISGQPNHEITVHYLDKPSNSYLVDGMKIIDDVVGLKTKEDLLFFIVTSNEAIQLCNIIRPKYPKVYCIEVFRDMEKDLQIFAESKDRYLELGNYDQKVVMATNVAEASLTIDGLKYVIDSGYELYSYFDPDANGQVLEKRLISQAQALQRRGRVGRTEPGICYHLLTKREFDELAPYPTPDILKQDITIDFIKVIQLTDNKTYDEGYQMLNQLMDPPKKNYVDFSKKLFDLYKITTTDGKLNRIGYNITQFSSLPLNRSLFLIYSYQLHCAREASIILGMMEALNGKISNLFHKGDTICNSDCKKESSKKLIEKLVQKKGDHFTYLNIYQKFKENTDQKAWARKYGIRLDTMNSAERHSKTYYHKIVGINRIPQIGGVEMVDVKKRLLEALILSHKHLVAKKLVPSYSKKNITGQISKDSTVNLSYNRKELANKSFIYDELVNVSNNWEFSVITFL